MTNPIQNRVDRIRRGEDPQFLARMPSGYAILSNQQPDAVRGAKGSHTGEYLHDMLK